MTVNASTPCQRQRFRGFSSAGVHLTVDRTVDRGVNAFPKPLTRVSTLLSTLKWRWDKGKVVNR